MGRIVVCVHPPKRGTECTTDHPRSGRCDINRLIGTGGAPRCLRPPSRETECKCSPELPQSEMCDINHLIGAGGPHRCLYPSTRETECNPDLPRSAMICDITHSVGASLFAPRHPPTIDSAPTRWDVFSAQFESPSKTNPIFYLKCRGRNEDERGARNNSTRPIDPRRSNNICRSRRRRINGWWVAGSKQRCSDQMSDIAYSRSRKVWSAFNFSDGWV